MTESCCSTIRPGVSRSIKAAVVLSCMLLMGTEPVLAQSSGDTKQGERKVVAQKRVEENIPGTYQYKSQYEMTKDEKGNYHSTYESQKDEWFCCMDWFSSGDERSTKADKP